MKLYHGTDNPNFKLQPIIILAISNNLIFDEITSVSSDLLEGEYYHEKRFNIIKY